MKQTYKFYKVDEYGAGLASGRAGLAIEDTHAANAEPGRYNPFDRDCETVLIDGHGVFTMFDSYLTRADTLRPFFLRTRLRSVWSVPEAVGNEEDTRTLLYTVGAYGFLLPPNELLDPSEFAAIIRAHYSMDNDKNRAVVRCLEQY